MGHVANWCLPPETDERLACSPCAAGRTLIPFKGDGWNPAPSRTMPKSAAWHAIARLRGLRQIPLGAMSDVWPDELKVVVTEKQYRCIACEKDIYKLSKFSPGGNVPKQTQKKSVQWRGFKDVRLSDAQRDAYEHWDAEDDDVYLLLASAVAAGYKFTMSYNGSNDTYTATLTGQDTAPAAAQGYSLSAFAPDFYNACRTLAYKHDLILEGDWSRIEVSASERWG